MVKKNYSEPTIIREVWCSEGWELYIESDSYTISKLIESSPLDVCNAFIIGRGRSCIYAPFISTDLLLTEITNIFERDIVIEIMSNKTVSNDECWKTIKDKHL